MQQIGFAADRVSNGKLYFYKEHKEQLKHEYLVPLLVIKERAKEKIKKSGKGKMLECR
ncbi:MAG: hypothetical protein ACC707_19550 [Thiohalomonadales bacterium]